MSALRETDDPLCARLPGAELATVTEDVPSWKVGDRMFACYGDKSPGVSVKCDTVETASLLIDAGIAERAPCFQNSWLRVPDDASPDEIAHRVTTCCDPIRTRLPKAVRNTLPAREGA